MQTLLVVELEIVLQSVFSVHDGLIILKIYLLIFHASPKPFHKNVVQCSSSAIPTDTHVSSFQPVDKLVTGKLRSLVIVENLWLRVLKCLIKCLQTKGCIQRD